MLQLTLYIPWPDQSQALSPETLSSFPWINNIRNQNLGTSYAHCYCRIKWKTQKYLCVCVHTQLYLTLPDSMDCSLPNSSVRRIFSVEILEWLPTFSSGGSFWPGAQLVSLAGCALGGGFFTTEPTGKTCGCVHQPYTLEIILIPSNLIHYYTEWPSLLLICNAPLQERSMLYSLLSICLIVSFPTMCTVIYEIVISIPLVKKFIS